MHIEYPLTLVDYKGEVFLVDKNEATRLARNVRWGDIILKDTPFEERRGLRGPNLNGSNVYAGRDFYGTAITNTNWPIKPAIRRASVDKQVQRAIELGLAIPHTRCWKKGPWASNKSQFREVRQQAGHQEQLSTAFGRHVDVRRKRDVPGWDRCEDRNHERNWKSQRRTQWK